LAAEQEEVPANIAAAITEISEHATLLIRDEIELAKAEITGKLRKILTGAVVGIAAGGFVAIAVLFLLIGLAYLIAYEIDAGQTFWGFFIVAALLLVLAALAGLLAFRAVRGGAPPAPTMAIDEARKIREAVSPQEPKAAS
jgi:uncharacterized membrane protein YqjE